MTEDRDDFLEASLNYLCRTILDPSDPGYLEVDQYIYAHEFGLALDLLAYFQLNSAKPLAEET